MKKNYLADHFLESIGVKSEKRKKDLLAINKGITIFLVIVAVLIIFVFP